MSRRVPLGSGWDSDAVLVDGRWVERTARRPSAARGLHVEVGLLPWLAARVPLPVPVPVLVAADPVTTRHRLVPGAPLSAPTPAQGTSLGRFLRTLHDLPLADAVAHGLPDPDTTRGWRDATVTRITAEVLPRLPPDAPCRAALDRVREAPADAVVHGDLGPGHVRVDDGTLTGVIDWGDARAGDPAKDLTWLLLGTPAPVAAAVTRAYGRDLTERAGRWRAVEPCWAVLHGLDTGDDALVSAALAALGADRGGAR